MKRTILTTAAFAAVILLVPAANARNIVSSGGGTGDWDDTDSWYLEGTATHPDPKPGADDFVTVQTGHDIDVDTGQEYADHLTVESGAQLDIAASCTLTLDGSDSSVSTVDGTINLLGSGSTLSFTSSHIIVGGGSIDGQDNSAVIEIASGETLTNAAKIEGNCQIAPAGGAGTTFTNYGTVHANNVGTLYVAPHSIGVSSGIWQVSTSSSAVLQIGVASAGAHTGSVNVSSGTLDIDYDFETEGQLAFTGGTIDVASTKTFEAS